MSRYDQKSINRINFEIKRNNYKEAFFLMNDYIIHYPNDNYVRLRFVSLLLKLGNKEKARKVLDETVLTDFDMKTSYASYYYSTVKLLIQEEKYQECLDYIYNNKPLFHNESDFYYVEAFCKKKLGQIISGNNYTGYSYQQIINFDENKTIAFASDENNILNKKRKGKFNPSFDIPACLKVIKSTLPDSCPYRNGLMFFEGIFRCEGCGTFLDRPTDLIVANGLLHSDNITFMLPGINPYNHTITDITDKVYQLSKK